MSMQTIEFTAEEIEVLREVLRHCAIELDNEVFRTDTRDFKIMLKHRKEVLEKIVRKFSAAPATAIT